MSLACLWVLPRPKRALAQNMLLLAGSVALALFAGELLCRWLLPPVETAEVVESDFAKRLADERRHAQSYDSVSLLSVATPTGRRLRANARVLFHNTLRGQRDVLIRTNELGFRGPQLGPKHAKRVLFLGDSITLADYLYEQDTHVELVGALARSAGRSIEVVNAGVAGVSLAEEIALFNETGLLAQPDAVVLGFYLNDFAASPGVVIPTPPRWLAGSRLVRAVLDIRARASLVETERDISGYGPRVRQWQAEAAKAFPPNAYPDYRISRGAFNDEIQRAFRDWGSAWSESVWREVLEPLFFTLARSTKERGIELYVLCFPVSFQVDAEFVADFPQQKLRELAARLGFPLLDLLPPLRAAARATKAPLFYDQCHYTPEGSRAVAGLAWEFLHKSGL
jgi:hypothetical protein